MEEQKKRVYGLDLLRGIAIVFMVIYHGLFSLVYIFGVDWNWFRDPIFNELIAPLIGSSFTLISGASSRFSRASWKRGLKILAWAMVMTVVTAVAVPDLIIRFGILHCMGCCMLLCFFLRPLLDRLDRKWGTILFLLLFAVTYSLPKRGYIGFGAGLCFPISTENPYLFPLGLMSSGFYSSDYYPLIPWFFLFVAGYYLGSWLKEGKGPQWLHASHATALEKLGQHSLVIYVLHQPLLIAAFWLLFWLFSMV